MNRILGVLLASALIVFGAASQARAGTAAFGGTLTISLGELPEARFQGTGRATLHGHNVHAITSATLSSANPLSNPNFGMTVTFAHTAMSSTHGPRQPQFLGTIGGGAASTPLHIWKFGIAKGVFVGTSTIPVTDPLNPISEVRITGLSNQKGALGRPLTSSASLDQDLTQNTLGLAGGLAKVCLALLPNCSPPLPLVLASGHTKLSGFGGFGIGGLNTIGGSGVLRISIDHAPWTIHTGTAVDQPDAGGKIPCTVSATTIGCVNVTAKGFMHGPASLSSSFSAATVNAPGVVQFVTPGQVTTNITQTSSVKVQLISRMRFKKVPEPGLLLLLGTGVVGLAVLGRRRMRK